MITRPSLFSRPATVTNKPNSSQLLVLLNAAKEVYKQIEGKKGLKGKKLSSGKHAKDINNIINECKAALANAKLDDELTIKSMATSIHTHCLAAAFTKHLKYRKGACVKRNGLQAHLNDTKHANHHHLTRLMFVVLDAAEQAGIYYDSYSHQLQTFPNIIPATYSHLYQQVYNANNTTLQKRI